MTVARGRAAPVRTGPARTGPIGTGPIRTGPIGTGPGAQAAVQRWAGDRTGPAR